MRLGDRRNVEAQVMQQLSMQEAQFQRLPPFLKRACWEGGLPAMLATGYKPAGAAADDGASSSGRQHGEVEYWRRQYVFVAATMPAATKGDVGTDLKYR
jgi:hypothetical protein